MGILTKKHSDNTAYYNLVPLSMCKNGLFLFIDKNMEWFTTHCPRYPFCSFTREACDISDHLEIMVRYQAKSIESFGIGTNRSDNINTADFLVEIVQCRPYSKTKSWRLHRVVEKAVQIES